MSSPLAPAELGHEYCVANRYIVQYRAGKGKAGGAVYGVKDSQDPDGPRKALKWPLRPSEWDAICALRDEETGEPKGVGIPRYLGHGVHWEGTYVLMEILGKPLLETFNRLAGDTETRWRALRPLGRLLLRRLRVVHECGLVHCDVQPNNIMFGRSDSEDLSEQLLAQTLPFLIDFGSAQRYPGPPKRADFGTVDFNSIRSAEGGARGPLDDLESLGWVLCHGLFGNLPWFGCTKSAEWKSGRLTEQDRDPVCREVALHKAALLSDDLSSLGGAWQKLVEMPAELQSYLQLCNTLASSDDSVGLPDYDALASCLGGTQRDPQAAEEQELAEYRQNLRRALPDQVPFVPKEPAPEFVAPGLRKVGEDPDDPRDPSGTWVLTTGLSIYTIIRDFETGTLVYEQAMAGGKLLQGDLVTLPKGDDWSWQVDLRERGTIRLRRKDRWMQTTFQKSGAKIWGKPRTAERFTTGRALFG